METKKEKTSETDRSGSNDFKSSFYKEGNDNSMMQSSLLMKLFEEELKDIYWAEKALKKAIPKMIKKASSDALKAALTNHLAETDNHIFRIEQVFDLLGKKASAVKCEAMEGLIKEAEEKMEDCETGAMCDAAIISAAQKIEHYEIATYGTLRQFAETLDMNDVVTLVEATLQEEKEADAKLTEVAVTAINVKAAEGQKSK